MEETIAKMIAERARAVWEEYRGRNEEANLRAAELKALHEKWRERKEQKDKEWLATYSDAFGTPLHEIQPFTQELAEIVETMQEKLSTETKILEGTMPTPDYDVVRDTLQNELSIPKLTEEQWKTHLHNGSLTIAHSLISTPVSSTSSSSARPNTPVSDTLDSDVRSCPMQTGSCLEMSGACGCVIGATNESSECTVPTTSEPTHGTPSEQK